MAKPGTEPQRRPSLSWPSVAGTIFLLGVGILVQQLDMDGSVLLGGSLITASGAIALWTLFLRQRVPKPWHGPIRGLLVLPPTMVFLVFVLRLFAGMRLGGDSVTRAPAAANVTLSSPAVSVETSSIKSGRELRAAKSAGRDYVPTTVEEIVAPLQEMTDFQISRATAHYVGQHYLVSGIIGNIRPAIGGGVNVFLELEPDMPAVAVHFDDEEQISIVTEANAGEILVVSGTFAEIGRDLIILGEGEVIAAPFL